MNLGEWRWTIASSESGLTPTQRLVGLTLALHMKANRPTCWPSIPLLAEETGLAESTVKAATAGLERAGFVNRKRGVGAGNATHYTAAFANVRLTAVSGQGKRPTDAQKRPSDYRETSDSRTGSTPSTSKTPNDAARLNGASSSAKFDAEENLRLAREVA